jgi:indolepyruvate ferredoxin oxidoreductase alpha subunit
VVLDGVARFIEGAVPAGLDLARVARDHDAFNRPAKQAAALLGEVVPARPPGFCVGCPERPVFSAMKMVEREVGAMHVSADIGCHTFAALPPFHIGNTVMGYGLGLASSTGVAPAFGKRVISIMGDGGFWHNGLTSGIAGAVFNEDDSVLIIMNNGYTAATGQQFIPSTGARGRPTGMDIETALRGVGVKWIERIRTYGVGGMVKALRRAMTTADRGLKVIIADGECQLARQRRIKPVNRRKLAAGERLVRTRYGIDDALCTGDHSCIRLSGCPSLTIKSNPDPLRLDPVAHVNNDCVGCGLCGEVAHAAALCPSFYRAEIVHNPGRLDGWLYRLRQGIIGRLRGRAAAAA